MRIQPENRVRKEDTGETSVSNDWPIHYCLERPFILLIVHRDQRIIQNYAASAALTLIETRLSLCIPNVYTNLGDLHHLLARRPVNILRPFSDKDLSTRRLTCVVLPKVWCHSQKALNKVTFLHSKDTTIYNNERSTVIYNKEKST